MNNPDSPAGKGIFISFEGGDGSGKSTQVRKLSARLSRCGIRVLETREPGGSAGAESVRNLLVSGDRNRWSPLCEALLMYSARADHLENTILPALEGGMVVITDRFSDSTMAYQGMAGELGEAVIRNIHAVVVGEKMPDLTVILDMPVEEGLSRATIRQNMQEVEQTRFERKGVRYHERVRKAFRDIAARSRERCVLLDATGDCDTVSDRVALAVESRFPDLFREKRI